MGKLIHQATISAMQVNWRRCCPVYTNDDLASLRRENRRRNLYQRPALTAEGNGYLLGWETRHWGILPEGTKFRIEWELEGAYV
jgi:hypothetical protein